MSKKTPINASEMMQAHTMFLNTTHLVLQGKGGVGKSLKAGALGQYFNHHGYDTLCRDTDPVNSTFYRMTGLNVELVPIAEGGSVVQRLFDPLFEDILETDRVSVVDNGASTFLPMLKFITSNYILQTMQDAGKQPYIHTVVTGGQAKDDTVTGLLSLIDMLRQTGSNTKIVVWQNEFWGIPEFNGKPLDQMPWFSDNGDLIQGLVSIKDRNSDAYATDMRLVTEKHMTWMEVKASSEFGTLAKSRIGRVYSDIFSELDNVFAVMN